MNFGMERWLFDTNSMKKRPGVRCDISIGFDMSKMGKDET